MKLDGSAFTKCSIIQPIGEKLVPVFSDYGRLRQFQEPEARLRQENSLLGGSRMDRISWQVEWVQKWPGFATANKVLEVGSGTFETLAILAEKYPEKRFVGVDYVFGDQAWPILRKAPQNLTAIKHDVRDFRLFSAHHFDFAFSVAVMEHIRELEAHLLAIYRVLTAGGRYCFKQTPFWSSSLGHHYEHNSAECPIPLYGHLYMTQEELGAHLSSQTGKGAPEVKQILRQVYQRPDLSRLSRTETKLIIEKSPFFMEMWDHVQDRNHTDELAERVVKNNLYQLDPKDLQISGVNCSLIKLEGAMRLRAQVKALPAKTGAYWKKSKRRLRKGWKALWHRQK